MYSFEDARQNMVNCQINTYGVVTQEILDAFSTVKREDFLPEEKKSIAYSGEELEVVPGRFMLEPAVHAKMIEALNPREEEIALDIGGVTGYSAALFSGLVSTVISLENDEAFLALAQAHWNDMGACNVVGMVGKLEEGNKKNMPYDLIFLNGAVAEIPENLVQQLSESGRMILIHKKPGWQMGEVKLITRNADGHYSSLELFEASAAYLPGFEPRESFSFE